MTDLQRWAIAYAKSLGWYIFPLVPRTKEPMTRNGFKDASNDLAQIRAWWTREPNANIAVDCGRSNLAVIDLDGLEAIERWNLIVDSLGLPYTRCAVQQTGGGGNHLVYLQNTERIRNSKRLGAKIDTRGDGGYIVLAPSVHPSGELYQWIEGAAPYDGMDLLPLAIVEKVRTPPAPASVVQAQTLNPKGAVKAAVSKIVRAPAGERNITLSNQAWFLLHLVKEGSVPQNVALEALQYAARSAGLTEKETTATIRSKVQLVLGA